MPFTTLCPFCGSVPLTTVAPTRSPRPAPHPPGASDGQCSVSTTSPSVVVDDYSLSRVPRSARYGWFQVAVQRFGQISALSQFLLGATLGFGMGFWQAFWAITLGAVILEVVSVFVGVIGMREGLNTSVIARWTGFGKAGSALSGSRSASA